MVDTLALKLALVLYLVLGQLANFLAVLRMSACILVGSRQAITIALAYDQLGNTAFGGNEDETISSAAGRARNAGKRWGCVLCRFLDFAFREEHCTKSIEKQKHEQGS